MPAPKVPNVSHGKTVAQMLTKNLAPVTSAGVNYTTVPHSATEGQRNYDIQSHLNEKNFRGMDITRVYLPNDDKDSQAARNFEQRRQTAMPWLSHFMVTETDAQRLNNPAQTAAMKQKQLAPPSTYGQFYAFMHALSAAFGTLQQSK